MMDLILIYSSPEGSQEIAFEGDRLSFGRGGEADHRFPDEGLSRLNSTIYREGDQAWIVDENSTNGTFVNGQQVSGSGTPLQNGDTIKTGHETYLKVRFVERKTASENVSNNRQTKKVSASSAPYSLSSLVPVALIAIALFVISVSAVFIGIRALSSNKPEIVQRNTNEDDPDFDNETSVDGTQTPTPTPKSDKTPKGTSVGNDNSSLTNSPEVTPTNSKINLPSGKKYQDMSDGEKRQFIEVHGQQVAEMIGNRTSGDIPPLAIDNIKRFLDGYTAKIKNARTDSCSAGSWVRSDMTSVLERASKNAPFIIHAFNEQGLDPRIGLYLAMIESEHCVCLQSGTGPLGMFQFTFATAKLHFVPSDGVVKGASPTNPDDRCKPEMAAHAAASYMKFLTGRFGTGPSSIPLAIGSYNSGEGGLSGNLKTALETNSGLPRDFWSLIANGDKLSKQFQSENFKYVPKFFAAAIIGENPTDFGINLQPLSRYSKLK